MVTRLYDRHGNRLALSCLHTVPLSTIEQVSNGGGTSSQFTTSKQSAELTIKLKQESRLTLAGLKLEI